MVYMSYSNNAKTSKLARICHVFDSSSQNEDHVKKPSSKDPFQNVDERVDPVDPVVCEDEVHLIHQNSPVRNSVCYNQGIIHSEQEILHTHV